MHDARARHCRELRVQRQQCVLQGVRAIAGAGVHHQSRWLVDDEQMPVAEGTCSGIASGSTSVSSCGCALTTTASPPKTASRGRAATPLTVTSPDFIQFASREREYCGNAAASA